MPHNTVSLSPGEWQIMDRLWEKAPRTLMELVRILAPDTGWSKSTIATMITRLETKGAITCTEGGKARLYSPAVSRDQAALQETESLLQRVYRGSVGLMVSTMARRQALTQEDIAQLRAILDQAEGGGEDA